jgi:hypothetical protein
MVVRNGNQVGLLLRGLSSALLLLQFVSLITWNGFALVACAFLRSPRTL